MKKGYTYIISNQARTVLYIGVTGNLEGRILQHKKDEGCKFSKKYKCKDLLYYEEFENIKDAINREKQLKNWHKEWKWNLVKSINNDLEDLGIGLVGK